ncbi:MAG TPA: ABC transporter ATP-binding protein [Acidobacteriaceae bacterium]|jgi:ABC-2 type transport system ATP-binding protein|nr:ABC transporter ATP-binding protein [Acidobacteriaceae bacterium]
MPPPLDQPAALLVASLVKRFGSTPAVDGVSLTIPQGASFGLLGPNGAGKSTLIRSIVGRVRPDSGSIRIFRHDVGSPAARADLGWVPQELALYPLLTCRENLHAFGRYQGLRGKLLNEAIAWCLDWAALADRAGSPVRTLSGGMKRRLNMAAGLIHRPRLVLLDEPTVGVDPQSRNRIFEMVEALRAAGATIIYTTHYMEEAERLCDTIAIIDHGQIIALGSKEALVAQAFGSRSSVTMHVGRGPIDLAAWAAARGGSATENALLIAVEKPAEIAVLLDAASRDGLEILDVALQRPNLESVFLHLTGKELRA